MNNSIAAAALATVAVAGGDQGYGQSRGYGYSAPVSRSYGHGSSGYGAQFGYDHGSDDHADYGNDDAEYGNDDQEYGNDDNEYGNDDNEYGTYAGAQRLGLGAAGQHGYQNELLNVGGVGKSLNSQVRSSKARAERDQYGDHAVERDQVGYSRRFAHAYGPEFGDDDGDNYGTTDSIDHTAFDDHHGEPLHDDHDDYENAQDDEGRHNSIWDGKASAEHSRNHSHYGVARDNSGRHTRFGYTNGTQGSRGGAFLGKDGREARREDSRGVSAHGLEDGHFGVGVYGSQREHQGRRGGERGVRSYGDDRRRGYGNGLTSRSYGGYGNGYGNGQYGRSYGVVDRYAGYGNRGYNSGYGNSAGYGRSGYGNAGYGNSGYGGYGQSYGGYGGDRRSFSGYGGW